MHIYNFNRRRLKLGIFNKKKTWYLPFSLTNSSPVNSQFVFNALLHPSNQKKCYPKSYSNHSLAFLYDFSMVNPKQYCI